MEAVAHTLVYDSMIGKLPNGSHRSLPGEWHGVPDGILAPVLTDFFKR